MGDDEEGADDDPVERVEQPDIKLAVNNESLVGVENEERSKEEAEFEDVEVEKSHGVPSLDENHAQDSPVLVVIPKHQDPEVGEEGHGGKQTLVWFYW